MSSRQYNFCAGPAALPTAVLKRAQEEMLDWQGRGLSVMEISHRHAAYLDMTQDVEAKLRRLMGIPRHYKVLFMQGGATAQFALLPLNLLGAKAGADYLDSGIWSTKAIAAMAPYGKASVVASSQVSGYRRVPSQAELLLNSEAAYVHYCPNETIGGLAFDYVPDTGGVPLVADMSSTILSEPIDVTQFGVIYAGAQKNIGPAGLTLVIIREDLLGNAHQLTPKPFNYALQAANDSMLNTPPTFGWYLVGLVFDWLLEQGGLQAMALQNSAKAEILYRAIDQSKLYSNNIVAANRSKMNVTFSLQNEALDAEFLQQAQANGLLNLKGHRSVGGMRASIYNAVSEAAVHALVAFMIDFETRHWA
ncbi:MAG: 3-phosphoserine/phosphohydroxythreonine transaminase [Gammaproteobacteria bacterium]|nr:3-phosphoserine/phosphohydroxythreonine transaminase [Gammaproteobacteria bacterium]